MSPKKHARLKSLAIDILVPDVGRIQRRIGTDSATRRNDYLAMIRALSRDGRLDVLRNLQLNVVSFALVYEAFTTGKLNKLPTVESLVPLETRWREWVADLEHAPVDEQLSDEHVAGHKYSLTRLLRHLRKDANVGDLPGALDALRVSYRKKPRSFNKTLASVRAFTRDVFRKQHPLYQQCAAVPVLAWKRKRQPKPQSVAQVAEWCEKMTPELSAIVWALATTGMLPKEYWFDGWKKTLHHLHIDGQKRAARDRDVPDLGYCVDPEMSHDAASRALALVVDGAFVLKDLRNTFANWMEHAGVPRTRRRMYMGHGAADVTDLYEQQEVAQFLNEDGAKMRAWLVSQGAPAQTVEFGGTPILKLEKHA